jgi:hypothetical protein
MASEQRDSRFKKDNHKNPIEEPVLMSQPLPPDNSEL